MVVYRANDGEDSREQGRKWMAQGSPVREAGVQMWLVTASKIALEGMSLFDRLVDQEATEVLQMPCTNPVTWLFSQF